MYNCRLIVCILLTLWTPINVFAGVASIRSIGSGGIAESIGGGSIGDTEWIDLMTVTEIAVVIPSLSKLREIYDSTEMGFKVEQSRHITVFMPNNDAINDAAQLDKIIPFMSYPMIVKLFSSHIIAEVVQASELNDGDYIFKTAPGDDLKIKIEHKVQHNNNDDDEKNERVEVGEGEGLIRFVEDVDDSSSSSSSVRGPPSVELKLDESVAKVVGANIDNANGVSYIIDGLLVPDDVREALDEAFELWQASEEEGDVEEGRREERVEEESQVLRDSSNNQHHSHPLRPENVAPDYIKETNLHHWFYGRAGGNTPEYRQHDDNTETLKQQRDQTERSTKRRSRGVLGQQSGNNEDSLNKVGVLANLDSDIELLQHYSF